MTDKIEVVKGETFNADIYIAGNMETIERVCRGWVMRGACVTIQEMLFAFTGGAEGGAKIGFINYQRFPSTADEITEKAIDLATELISECCQLSASVVTTDNTYFLQTDAKR